MTSHITKEAALYKYFEDHKLYPEYIDIVDQFLDGAFYEAEITYGDWKHEHLRFDHLVKDELQGINHAGEVTWEDGSDCYSKIHRFYVCDEVVDTLIAKYNIVNIQD